MLCSVSHCEQYLNCSAGPNPSPFHCVSIRVHEWSQLHGSGLAADSLRVRLAFGDEAGDPDGKSQQAQCARHDRTSLQLRACMKTRAHARIGRDGQAYAGFRGLQVLQLRQECPDLLHLPAVLPHGRELKGRTKDHRHSQQADNAK